MTEKVKVQFQKLLEFSVWKRIWVVQEVVLSEKVVIVLCFHQILLSNIWILKRCHSHLQMTNEIQRPYGWSGQYLWEFGFAQQMINLRYERKRPNLFTAVAKIWTV